MACRPGNDGFFRMGREKMAAHPGNKPDFRTGCRIGHLIKKHRGSLTAAPMREWKYLYTMDSVVK